MPPSGICSAYLPNASRTQMAKMIVDAAGIATISGAMLKPKKIDGHNHGNYLIAVHRVAPTTNPNCQRIYSKRSDAYKRSTPVTSDGQQHQAKFLALKGTIISYP